MKLLKFASVLLVPAVLFSLVACSGGSDTIGDHPAVKVILDYWEAMNDFDAEKALSYYEPAYREQERKNVETDIAQMAPLKFMNFKLTISQASEPVYIEDNRVEVRVTLNTPIDQRYLLYNLVLLNGKWKIIRETTDPAKSPPREPSGLVATVISSTRVDLSWSDNSSREDGYHIQRATDAGFSKDLQTFTVAANIASYSDTSVSPATTYFYRVTAFGQAGDSRPTFAAQVTTP